MGIKQNEKIFLNKDEIREVIKDLEPGTMITFEMPGIPDGTGPDRKKEGEDIYGRPV